MEYRIEEHQEINMIGIKITTTNEKRRGYKEIAKMWKAFTKDQDKIEVLKALMDSQPKGMIGANVYNIDLEDGRKFDYYIGVASNQEVPEGFESYTIPARTWAIFPCKRANVGKTEYNVIAKWQPQSDYRVLNDGYITGFMAGKAPDLEVYGMGDEAEVWVAVEKK